MYRLGHTSPVSRTVLYAGDLVAAVLAWFLAFGLRISWPIPFTVGQLPMDRLHLVELVAPFLAVGQILLIYFLGLYDPPLVRPRLELLRKMYLAATGGGFLLASGLFLLEAVFPRSVVIVYVLLAPPVLLLWRLLFQRFFRPAERRVVLVGSGAAAREVAAGIQRHHWHGLEVVGHLVVRDELHSEKKSSEANGWADLGPRLGEVDDLPRILGTGVAQDVILAVDPGGWQSRLVDRLSESQTPARSVLLLPGPFESLIGRMRYRWIHDLPLIEVFRESETRIRWPLKRLFDLVAGCLLLLVFSPAMVACAVAVRLGSRGSVLYRQTRLGVGRRPFTLLKFRTMRLDAETEDQELLAVPDDPRTAGMGSFLRRYRLDELPQLINVLAGQMSLVGPRPERPGLAAGYLAEVSGYGERYSVRPGVTGLAQVNGDYHSSAANKLRYDLAYIANWSLGLDLSILFRTLKIVLTSRGV